MKLSAPPIAACAAAVIAGLVLLAASGITLLLLSGRFHAQAPRLTVPGAVDIEVQPDTTIVIQRELAGPHITVNRPLQPLPDDLTITVTDAQSGQPLATERYEWWTRQQFFGLERHRRGIVAFRSPAHGRVRIDVRGSFDHDQVIAVNPAFHSFSDRVVIPLGSLAGLGGLLTIVGLIACVVRVARTPRMVPGLPDER